MTELQQFKAMLERAGIGHGLRHDYNPPGEAVMVETEPDDRDEWCVSEFWFDDEGNLREHTVYKGEEG